MQILDPFFRCVGDIGQAAWLKLERVVGADDPAERRLGTGQCRFDRLDVVRLTSATTRKEVLVGTQARSAAAWLGAATTVS